ncbi:MAG TPA: hypothetical protein VN018_07865 [Brevundimonas sp.]|nr:hypothetical protein [Brevundimonas sp.]
MTVPAVKPARSAQIRPRLRVALDALVGKGLTIGEAAQEAGLSYEGLRLALHKPHVQAFMTGLKRERLGLESLRSFQKVVDLRDNAVSEKVSLDASKAILTAAGDLEPERHSSPSSGAVLQIIVNTGHALTASPPANGVVELPAFNPATWGPVIEHAPQPDDRDDDGGE